MLHSLAAQFPLERYRLGSLKLNVAMPSRGIEGWSGTCDLGSADGNEESCTVGDPGVESPLSFSICLKELLGIGYDCIHVAWSRLLAWRGVSSVTVPLGDLDWVAAMLPPALAQWVWQTGILPRLIDVV